VDREDSPQDTSPDEGYVLELTVSSDDAADPDAKQDDLQWYEPSVWSRLAVSRPLVILLVIAFLALVIGPSLIWAFHRDPEPPKPKPTPVRGYPALHERTLPQHAQPRQS
jgi:hypothetical protein